MKEKNIFIVCSWCKKWEKEKGHFVIFSVPNQVRNEVKISDTICPECKAEIRKQINKIKES
jgi:hypothetical protein